MSGAESYDLSIEQIFEGESLIPLRVHIEVDSAGLVKDSSRAYITYGNQTKEIADLVSFNGSTKLYSIEYAGLINIYTQGRYNFRLQARKDPDIESQMFATAKLVTGAQLKDGYTQMPSKVDLTNFTVPSNGQVYGDSGVELAEGFPGTIDKTNWFMFQKDINGVTAFAGDTVQFAVYVKLDDGCVWGDDPTATLNGTAHETRIKPSEDVRAFSWTFTIQYTDKIHITDQTAETLEYAKGEDVKLFVTATGADSYQWQKYDVTSGAGKQKYSPKDIPGATDSTYTLSKADSSAQGTYRCALSSSEGTIYSRDIVVKMEDDKTANPFVDVSEADYFYDPVLWAVDEGITNGTDATHFSPEATCTRGQVVAFLWRAAGSPAPSSSTNPFTDVSSSDYYYNAVLWAVGKNITNGTSATTFGPNAGCTRGQVVTFLHRFENSPAPASSTNPFIDVSSSEYYYTPVLWAVGRGITNGTDATHFSPNETCTRGQIVTFLYRDMK